MYKKWKTPTSQLFRKHRLWSLSQDNPNPLDEGGSYAPSLSLYAPYLVKTDGPFDGL